MGNITPHYKAFSVRRYSPSSEYPNYVLCIDGFFPLRTEDFVNCERNATDFFIIKLEPRSFRFFLKTFPSINGRWTLYRTAVVELPDGSGKATTGRWTMGRWVSVDGKMDICGRQIRSPKRSFSEKERFSKRAWSMWHSADWQVGMDFTQTHRWRGDGAHAKFTHGCTHLISLDNTKIARQNFHRAETLTRLNIQSYFAPMICRRGRNILGRLHAFGHFDAEKSHT